MEAFIGEVTPHLASLRGVFNQLDFQIGQQYAWDSIRTYFGSDTKLMYVVCIALAHTIPFYGLNIFYSLITWAFPNIIKNFRWNGTKYPPTALVFKALALVTFYHLVTPIVPYYLYDAQMRFHPNIFAEEAPGVLTILMNIVVAYLVTDFMFYWAHRLLHHPWFYARIHKQHHTFIFSIGWAAEYAHPFEFIVGNILPVATGPILFKFHFFSMCVWLSVAIMGTTMGHSGLFFPISWSNGFHDFHHSHNVGVYGSMMHWDYLMGTDRAYRAFIAKKKRESEQAANDAEDDNATETVGKKKATAPKAPRRLYTR